MPTLMPHLRPCVLLHLMSRSMVHSAATSRSPSCNDPPSTNFLQQARGLHQNFIGFMGFSWVFHIIFQYDLEYRRWKILIFHSHHSHRSKSGPSRKVLGTTDLHHCTVSPLPTQKKSIPPVHQSTFIPSPFIQNMQSPHYSMYHISPDMQSTP